MTREKAIKIIREIEYPVNGDNKKERNKAINMAIKALEQEPCDDVVSREMALEKMADYVASGYTDSAEDFEEYSRIICQLPSVTQKPIECEDVVSRQAVLDTEYQVKIINDIEYVMLSEVQMKMRKLPSVRPQEPKTGQFAKWVAREIFDDMWEYNKDAFAELACRKLEKLGIVKANGDVWELVEQESGE